MSESKISSNNVDTRCTCTQAQQPRSHGEYCPHPLCSAQLRHTGGQGQGGPPYILVQCRPAAGCKQEMSDVNPKHIINAETEVVQIQDSYMLCYNFYYMCHY